MKQLNGRSICCSRSAFFQRILRSQPLRLGRRRVGCKSAPPPPLLPVALTPPPPQPVRQQRRKRPRSAGHRTAVHAEICDSLGALAAAASQRRARRTSCCHRAGAAYTIASPELSIHPSLRVGQPARQPGRPASLSVAAVTMRERRRELRSPHTGRPSTLPPRSLRHPLTSHPSPPVRFPICSLALVTPPPAPIKFPIAPASASNLTTHPAAGQHGDQTGPPERAQCP